MKEYKCMGCLTSFESEYKEDCPSCGDDSDVIEVSAHTDKLSVEKLQEQLNTAKKALTEIQQLKRRDTTNLGMINKLQTIAKDALAAIEKGENNEI